MLWTLIILLVVLWALGMLTSTSLGGLLHILLVVAAIILIVQIVQGRRVV